MNNSTLLQAKQLLENGQQEGRCPIWRHPVVPFCQIAPNRELRRYYYSPRSGGIYSIPWNDNVSNGLDLSPDAQRQISRWIYEENARDRIPYVDRKMIDQVCQRHCQTNWIGPVRPIRHL